MITQPQGTLPDRHTGSQLLQAVVFWPGVAWLGVVLNRAHDERHAVGITFVAVVQQLCTIASCQALLINHYHSHHTAGGCAPKPHHWPQRTTRGVCTTADEPKCHGRVSSRAKTAAHGDRSRRKGERCMERRRVSAEQ
jgi:hypothetical protein